MVPGLMGKKLGMTRLFREDGKSVTVTVIEVGPCYVIQVRKEANGQRSIQLGFAATKEKSLTKPVLGHLKKAKVAAVRYVRELRLPQQMEMNVEVGQALSADAFTPGEFVDVTGTSIGKGFQGGVKRWHWKGGKATHGSTQHRAPGSIGSTTTPGRTIRGHHLPGHMGHAQVTVQNLEVIKIDAQEHLLVVKGAVPGPANGLVIIRHAVKRRKAKKAPPPPKAKQGGGVAKAKGKVKKQ
ncbi:MAG: 50S ribosomal protein L3 [Candidatus Omnitrophica bacterium]|nr:50S ribosomal protein L3 [Candidatus Omnitrophota bacterium]